MPGATGMRRSTTLSAGDAAGSVIAPILASLASSRHSALPIESSIRSVPQPAGPQPRDGLRRALRTTPSPGGADDGGIDRRAGRGAPLDGGRAVSGDGALLSRHARAHAPLG